MNNYHLHSLNAAKEKYYKFKRRLEKNISSGQFDSLSRKKKNILIARVEKYRSRLEKFGFSMRGAAVAGSMTAVAAIPNITNAQSPSSDPKFFERNAGVSIQSMNDGQIANIDADSDLEIIASYGSIGYVINGNVGSGFSGASAPGLSGLSEDFVLGDVDGDEFLDVVWENSGYIRVAINDQNGGFSSSAAVSSGGESASDIEIADFDSDGDNDIIWTNGGSYLRVAENYGSGYFSGGTQSFSLGGSDPVEQIELADLDGDGDTDLVLSTSKNYYYYDVETSEYTRHNYETIEVRNNTAGGEADPVFSAAVTVRGVENESNYITSYIRSMELVDVDGDGDLDIVSSFSNYYDFSDAYLQVDIRTGSHAIDNPGFTLFDKKDVYETYSRDIGITDVDGDGDLDVVLTNSDYAPYLFMNNENGLSVYSLEYGGLLGNFSSSGGNLVVGDLDGDGVDDIIFAYGSSSLYLNVYPPFPTFNGDMVVNEGLPSGSAIGKVETYGQDVTVSISGSNAGFFSYNAGTNEVTITQDLDWETNSSLFFSLEITSDGVTETLDRMLTVVNRPELGHGTFSEEPLQLFGDFGVAKAKFVDIDNDGDQDLITAAKYGSGPSELEVSEPLIGDYPNTLWTQLNGGVFTPESLEFLGTKYGMNSFTFSDIDQDGDEDLVASQSFCCAPPSLETYLNFEGEYFSNNSGVINSGYFSADQMLLGDFDGDGIDDLVADEYFFKGVQYGFMQSNLYVGGEYGSVSEDAIAIGDLDGDGVDDFVYADRYDVKVVYGSSSFFAQSNAEGETIIAGGESNYIFDLNLADIDGDGNMDILISGGEYGLVTYLNTGSGFEYGSQVEESVFEETGESSYSFSVPALTSIGDLDGDGDQDLAIYVFRYEKYEGEFSFGADVAVSLNDGDGNFSEIQRFNTQALPFEKYLGLVDVDNDSDLDIVVNSYVPSYGGPREAFVTLEEEDYLSGLLVFKNVNAAPTDIELSVTSVAAGSSVGSSVGELSVVDPNVKDEHTIFLTAGDGSNDVDNSKFIVDGNELIVIGDISQSDSPLNINVKAIDDYGLSVIQSFELTVSDPVLGVSESSDDDLVLFPNPGRDYMKVSLDNEVRGQISIKISDLAGRVVHQMNDEKRYNSWSKDVPMASQEPGIYIVELSVDGQTFKQRWIKK